MALHQEKIYTIEDIYALPDGQRAELIDGQLYDMAPPNRIHQKLVNRLSQTITNYIDSQHGGCEVYPAPFAVFLNGCNGAPDWIIEIVSASTERVDYGIKLFKYRSASVREYWVVNPRTRTLNVYDFENEKETRQYSFDEEAPVCIYNNDLAVKIADLI